MEKYYLWKIDERFMETGFDTFEEAFEIAMNNNCVTEIEKTIWYDEEDYQNRKPADEFETVWKRQ